MIHDADGLRDAVEIVEHIIRAAQPPAMGRPQWWVQKSSVRGGVESVTNVDIEIEAAILGRLRCCWPSASILSEESSPSPEALSADLCFVVDPLDGTAELISGSSSYAISVAMVCHREVVAAVVAYPGCSRSLSAYSGGGAALDGLHISVSTRARLAEARIAVSPRQVADPRMKMLRDRLGKEVSLCPLGALTPKVGGVCVGVFDAAVYLPLGGAAAVWDYAGAGFVLREAGGTLTAIDGADLLTSLEFVHHGGWVASNGLLHRDLLEAIRASVDH